MCDVFSTGNINKVLRFRAWLRLAVMQKRLADYLQELVERRDTVLIEYYEPHALMMSDEVFSISFS